MLGKSLAKLLPPADPKNTSKANELEAAEKALGTSLPSDWIDFCKTYGTFGSIFPTGISIHNPLDRGQRGTIKGKLERYREEKEEEDDDELFPYDFMPELGGLLPFGGTDQRKEFFFLTTGKPEKWRTVVWDQEAQEWNEHKLSFTQFMTAIFSGKQVAPFKKGWITAQGSPLKFSR